MLHLLFLSALAALVSGAIAVVVARILGKEGAGATWAGTVVAILTLGATVFFGVQTHDDGGKGAGGDTPPSTPPATPSTPPTTPSTINTPSPHGPFVPGAEELPAQLVGEWQGTMTQFDPEYAGQKYKVIDTFEQSVGGSKIIGTHAVRSAGCEWTLLLDRVSADSISYTGTVVKGIPDFGCIDHVPFQLKYIDNKHLLLTYKNDKGDVAGEAKLTRS